MIHNMKTIEKKDPEEITKYLNDKLNNLRIHND